MSTIITTGGTGLVGSRLTEVLGDDFSFTNLDLRGELPIDITDENAVTQYLNASPAEWVIHLAAITDVTRAHEENGDTNGLTYKVNVLGTESVTNACKNTGKKLIHISTAYIFDGKKETPYIETDAPNPIEWYGATKAKAEDVVISSNIHAVILRIDNPFRSTPFEKQDLVQRIATKLLEGSLPPQFSDSHFGPTYVEDTARVIKWLVQNNAKGVYHATNNESWTPYAFAQAVADRLKMGDSVKEGSLTEFLKAASRPYQRNTALDCSKLLRESSLELTPIKEALFSVQLPTPE